MRVAPTGSAQRLLSETIDVGKQIGFNERVVRCAFPTFAAIAASFVVISGCATGASVVPRGGDGGAMDGSRGTTDGETGVCDPLCDDGEMCSLGTCVPADDADGDGLVASADCDDADPLVGATLEQPCTGECGAGVERCTDGVWGLCSAPTTCDCEAGTPARTIPCMSCGTQRQACVGGTWENDGTCTGAGPCSAGEIGTGGACGNCGMERRSCDDACTWGAWACEGEGVCATGETDTETQPCGGSCGGMQSRTRTCDAACGWGVWSAWGTCSGGGGGACTAGATETRTQPCGNCGSQTQTRTCSSSCAWGAWTNSGSCSGQGPCAPGATRACANADRCGQEVCGGSCSWGGCSPVVPTGSGGCLHTRPGTSTPGNNFRCCTRTSGDLTGWQFCLPPGGSTGCTWSTACEATTSC